MTKRFSKGFTIVELLIVVLVIGILAAITIVVYKGMQDRAYTSAIQADLALAAKQIQVDYNLNGSFPATAAAANNGKGLTSSNGTTFSYSLDTSTSPATFCLAAISARPSVPDYVIRSSAALTTGRCGGDGLIATYFSNMTLSGAPALTRTDTTVNYNWGGGSPDPSIPIDFFSARWTGFLTPTVTGTYTFTVTSDDGERLWVNGTQVVNWWTPQGPTPHSGTIALTAGVRVPIVYEMFEQGGGAYAALEWTPPSGSQAVIPQTALSTN